MSALRIAIVGAGMAGLSCAQALAASGHAARLFDKGRGPGGRMSTRRIETPLGPASFDHGAQYFTARAGAFVAQVSLWHAQGQVAPWPAAGEDAWVGTPGMNAVIRAMADGRDLLWNTRIERIERRAGEWTLHSEGGEHGGFDAVVLAIPAEQALTFLSLHDFAMAREAMLARSQPCWTGMFAFAAPLPGDREAIRDAGILAWAARNSAKPGRSGPESWVVQAGPDWSRDHVEDPAEEVVGCLLAALGEALGSALPEPVVATAHRWRYAMSAGLRHGALWNPAKGLGVCADWLLGPRVECAWLSGRQLAGAIAADARSVRDRAAVPGNQPA